MHPKSDCCARSLNVVGKIEDVRLVSIAFFLLFAAPSTSLQATFVTACLPGHPRSPCLVICTPEERVIVLA